MTELKDFLTAVYDSVTDAELQALEHGRARMHELVASRDETVDLTVPVYHAADVELTLDVGLEAVDTETGMEVHVTESAPENETTLVLSLELLELLERDDLDYEDVIDGEDRPRDPDDDEPAPGRGITAVETVQVGPAAGQPRWAGERGESATLLGLYDRPAAGRIATHAGLGADGRERVRAFLDETAFERQRILVVGSVGPTACHDTIDVEELAVAEGELTGHVRVIDTSDEEEACAEVITYPVALVRVGVDDDLPDRATVRVVDGWGTETTESATVRDDIRDESDDTSAHDATPQASIDAIRELEPRFAGVLAAQGIHTVADLAATDPERLAAAISEESEDVSPAEAEGWLHQARALETMFDEVAANQPVELVDGIGPTYGGRLREHGIEVLADLLDATPEEIADVVSGEDLQVTERRTRKWLDQALRELELAAENAEDDGINSEEYNG